jgi:outer membrane PBP1 activator LpoA protein
MGVGTTYNAAFNSRSSPYNQCKLGDSFVMTSNYLSNEMHNRTFYLAMHRSSWLIVIGMMMLLSSCATSPPSATTPKSVQANSSYPVPVNEIDTGSSSTDDLIEPRIVEWNKAIARERGWLYALSELDAIEPGYISARTELLIRSQLLWLKGEVTQSNQILNQITPKNQREQDLLLQERQRRFIEAGKFVEAARVALDRASLYDNEHPSVTHSTVFDLLSRATTQRLASELRRTEPKSDWHGWLSLNKAYRAGRLEVLAWLANHPRLPSYALELPSGLRAWLENDPPSRIAVLLPLSGRLKSAGQNALDGIAEGLFATFRDPAIRPELVTIDTEAAVTGAAAYAQALEMGADFVIGPLTKERVSELQAIDQLPIPVLALNRSSTSLLPNNSDSPTPPNTEILSLSLAPEDEAEQLAHLAWAEGLRRPMLIAPDTAWGERMRAAFYGAWRQLGGFVRETALLSEGESDNKTIANALATLASEERIREVERAFEAPVDTQARRRDDLDSVVMLVPTPQMAREIRPLLRFHYAGKLPVFAPSAVFQSDDTVTNRDLNGIKFVVAPSALMTSNPKNTPLHSLGVDAAALVDHYRQANESEGTLLFGYVGNLRVDMRGNVRRSLQPVVFSRGRVRPI